MKEILNQQVTIGITGGISAYRSLELIRLLVKSGQAVKAIATPTALQFVTPLSIEALTQNKLVQEHLDSETKKINHIETAYKSDLMIVAPATCNFIAKLAHGIADNLLLQTILSFKGPLLIAPAMETNMWQNPATQANIDILKARGIHIIGPEAGDLASGRSGLGRMTSVETLYNHIMSALTPKDYKGIRALVTAGPTIERLDPVRYLTNDSSGKMGVALAKALAQRGAEVHLVHGPLQAQVPDLPEITAYPVQSAEQMLDQVCALNDKRPDLAILCAAVADFRPKANAEHKIKKTERNNLEVELVKNPDILATLGSSTQKPFLVGFAAETCDLEKNAIDKCRRKNADMICANLINAENPVFGRQDNQLTIVDQNGVMDCSQRENKAKLAHFVLDKILATHFF